MAFQLGEDPSGKPVSIKCTVEGFPRVVIESGGGGGGGDASAANQLTQIARADTTITALGQLLSETTGLDILVATQEVRDGITALGGGATIADLFTQLSDLNAAAAADALVQAGIAGDVQLSTLALQAIEPDVEEIRSDADAQRIALESLAEALKDYPTFTVTTGAQTLPLAQGSLLSIALASPSAVTKLRIRDIRIRNLQTANIAGVVAKFELRRFATHSAGTLLTPEAIDSADALSSDITARRGATLASEGTAEVWPAWYLSTDEYTAEAVEIESQMVANQNTHSLISQLRGAKLPTIRPGEGISIRLSTTLSAAASFEVTIQFTQE